MSLALYTINNNCMNCGACEGVCPRSAIIEAKRQFVIRRSGCDSCGICVGFCPYRAIVKRA
jgi:MinD superfamily P-loop ATPase